MVQVLSQTTILMKYLHAMFVMVQVYAKIVMYHSEMLQIQHLYFNQMQELDMVTIVHP